MVRSSLLLSESLLEKIGAVLAPVTPDEWVELFLERVEALRGRADGEKEIRISHVYEEGFAVRWVGPTSQKHVFGEGIDPERILGVCERGPAGASDSRNHSGFPHSRSDAAAEREPPSAESELFGCVFGRAREFIRERVSGEASISLEWRRREIQVAPIGSTMSRDTTTRAVLTVRGPGLDRDSWGVGAECLESLGDRACLERCLGDLTRRRQSSELPREAPAGETVIVLAPGTGGVFLHEACGHLLEGDLVLRGQSPFRNLLGQKVAERFVELRDEPGTPDLEGSYRCDDEGTASQGTALIERGVVRNFLTDRFTGQRLGWKSTGNGRRESFRELPMPRMSNTYLKPGAASPEEILRGTSRGIYVEHLEGGRVDPATGEFLFRASGGRLIEGGRLTAPLLPFWMSGMALAALAGIDGVGNDFSFGTGAGSCGKEGQKIPVAVGQPTIRIRSLAVRPA